MEEITKPLELVQDNEVRLKRLDTNCSKQAPKTTDDLSSLAELVIRQPVCSSAKLISKDSETIAKALLPFYRSLQFFAKRFSERVFQPLVDLTRVQVLNTPLEAIALHPPTQK